MTDKQQLDAELTALLPLLPGWQLDPRYNDHCWCAALIDGTGKGLHINATQAKGRFYISGMWPSDSDHQQCIPDRPQHITIARNRSPEKIAADLQRRFLPWYTTAYAEQAERAAKRNDIRRRQQEITVELAAILKADASRRMQSNPCQIYASGITVDVHGNGEVSVELRYTTVKVAKAVLRAIVNAGGLC